MKVMVALDGAIEIEEKIRSCYELLSRISENGISAELKKLAQEEKSHVNVLKTGKSFVVRAPGAFGRETVSDAEICLGLAAVAGLEDNLKNQKIGLPAALKKLYRLEKKFERVHMNTAVEFKEYSLKKLFEALARADAEHRKRLERLIDRLRPFPPA